MKGVDIEFGDHITLICGKNGTSKSSILGISAQMFSFDKNYQSGEELSFNQIATGGFKSQFSEHFRISNKYDIPGSMKVGIELYDGYSESEANAKLELMKRQNSSRPVVRNNSTAVGGDNTSRNFTHPVIFLSLKRLFPIAARDYNIIEYRYLNSHLQDFISLTNEILNRTSSKATGTKGTIDSAVSHGDNYDQDSVSAGEDNAGQIVLAIMSFRKLKEEYPDYKGGLLLIDEADAGLFPTAQINLLKMLDRECKNLDLQVVMTSHSPVMIEYIFEQSREFRRRFYRNYYEHDDHVKIANVLQNEDIQWNWVVSYDNTDEICKMYEMSHSLAYGLNYSAQRSYVGNEVMFFSKSLKVAYEVLPHAKSCA